MEYISSSQYKKGMLEGDSDLIERMPRSIGNMTMSIFFYKGKKMDVVDFADMTDQAQPIIAAAYALQGLVAREEGSGIFLALSESDRIWANFCENEYQIKFNKMSVSDLFAKYRKYVKKLILHRWECDYLKAYEFNIAFMMASLSNGIAVSDEVLIFLQELGYDVEVEDISGKWANRVLAYQYAYENILPRCNMNYVAATGFWQHFNDYVYATQTFTFMLSIKIEEEKELINKILSFEGFVKPALVFGYGLEGDDLLLESIRHGFSYVVNDYFSNSTFFSSFDMQDTVYKQETVYPVAAQKGKVYIGLFFSDGDNLQFNQGLSSYIWRNKDKGVNPVGMQLNPVLFELAPPILRWYYDHLGENDEIMAGPNGFSYVWEDDYDKSFWKEWHKYNNFYINLAGMSTITTSKLLTDQQLAKSFTARTTAKGSYVWHCNTYDTGTVPYGKPYIFNDVPLVITSCITYPYQLYDNIMQWQPQEDKPLFVGICLTQAGMGADAYTHVKNTLEEVRRNCPGIYEFLLPTQMMLSAKKWMNDNNLKND